ncbi:unnamed protein product [Meloidogyne enterolobii]|uniref:Uncharacterized protein n=1 Tax=Meloidogyne enterolobii TaxID=390850 RepID=A0ACB0Z6M4_MELEN
MPPSPMGQHTLETMTPNSPDAPGTSISSDPITTVSSVQGYKVNFLKSITLINEVRSDVRE